MCFVAFAELIVRARGRPRFGDDWVPTSCLAAATADLRPGGWCELRRKPSGPWSEGSYPAGGM